MGRDNTILKLLYTFVVKFWRKSSKIFFIVQDNPSLKNTSKTGLFSWKSFLNLITIFTCFGDTQNQSKGTEIQIYYEYILRIKSFRI